MLSVTPDEMDRRLAMHWSECKTLIFNGLKERPWGVHMATISRFVHAVHPNVKTDDIDHMVGEMLRDRVVLARKDDAYSKIGQPYYIFTVNNRQTTHVTDDA